MPLRHGVPGASAGFVGEQGSEAEILSSSGARFRSTAGASAFTMAVAACAGSVPSASSSVVSPLGVPGGPPKGPGPFFSLSVSSTASQDSSPSAASAIGSFFPAQSAGMSSSSNVFAAADSPSSMLDVSAQNSLPQGLRTTGGQAAPSAPSSLPQQIASATPGAPTNQDSVAGLPLGSPLQENAAQAGGLACPPHPTGGSSGPPLPLAPPPSCFPGVFPTFNSGGAGGMPFRGPQQMSSPFPVDLNIGGSQPGTTPRASHDGSFLPQVSGIGGVGGGAPGFPGLSNFAGVDAARAALFFAHNSSCPPAALPSQSGAIPSQPSAGIPGGTGPSSIGSNPTSGPPGAPAGARLPAGGGVGEGATGNGPQGPGNFLLSSSGCGAPQTASVVSLFGGGGGNGYVPGATGRGAPPASEPPQQTAHFPASAPCQAVGGASGFSMPSPSNCYGLPYLFGSSVPSPAAGCPSGPWPSSSLSLSTGSLLMPSNVQTPDGFSMPLTNVTTGPQAQPSPPPNLGTMPGAPAACPEPMLSSLVPPLNSAARDAPHQATGGLAQSPPPSLHHASVPQGTEGRAGVPGSIPCSPMGAGGGLSGVSNVTVPGVTAGGASAGSGASDNGAVDPDSAESIPSTALPKKYSGIWFDPQQNCWRASWVCATSGKRKFRYFSAAKFGHRHALQLAKVTKERAVERKKIRVPSAAHQANRGGAGASAAAASLPAATPQPDDAGLLSSKGLSPEKSAADPLGIGQQNGGARTGQPKAEAGGAEPVSMSAPPASPSCMDPSGGDVPPASPFCESAFAGQDAPSASAPEGRTASHATDDDGRGPTGALDPVALAEKAKEMLKVSGVYYDSARMIWRAFWHEGGRRVIRYFTVNKHGFHRAHELALLTRRQAAMAMQQRRRQLTAGLVLAVNGGASAATAPGTDFKGRPEETADATGAPVDCQQVPHGVPGAPVVSESPAAGNALPSAAGPSAEAMGSPHALSCTCGQVDGLHAPGCQLMAAARGSGLQCAATTANAAAFLFATPNNPGMSTVQGVPGPPMYPAAHQGGAYYGQQHASVGMAGLPPPSTPTARTSGGFDPSPAGSTTQASGASGSSASSSTSGTAGTTSSGGSGCRVDYLERVAQLPKEEQVEWSEELKAWVVTPFTKDGNMVLPLGKGAAARAADKGEGGAGPGARLSRMADGREILKMFTIRKYGFRVARERAIEWRNRRREKVRVEAEQQQMLQLRQSKQGGAKGRAATAREAVACSALGTGVGIPGLEPPTPPAAVNTAPGAGVNAIAGIQADTRRTASPSFSASTCSSNPSSPPNSSGPPHQPLNPLVAAATGTFGGCDSSAGLPSSPFMHLNMPSTSAGQTPVPRDASAPAAPVVPSGYSNTLSSPVPHLSPQNPLFFPQGPGGGVGGLVNPLGPVPTGLGPTPTATASGALAPGTGSFPSLPGAGCGAGPSPSPPSALGALSSLLSATPSGLGVFAQNSEARGNLTPSSSCGDLLPPGMSDSLTTLGDLFGANSCNSSLGSMSSNLGFVTASSGASPCSRNRDASSRDPVSGNWLFLSDTAANRSSRSASEEARRGENPSALAQSPSDLSRVGVSTGPPDHLPAPPLGSESACASPGSLPFFPSLASSTPVASSSSYSSSGPSVTASSTPSHSVTESCSAALSGQGSSPGEAPEKRDEVVGGPSKPLSQGSQGFGASVAPETFGACPAGEPFRPALSSESFFLPSTSMPQAATAAATAAAAAAAAAALTGPPPAQLLLQQQREQRSRRKREGGLKGEDDGKKKEGDESGVNLSSEEGCSVEAVGVMRNAVSHILRNLQEVCIPGLLCSCTLESESFNYLATRLDEWTKAVHTHRQLCASVLSNPNGGGAGKEAVASQKPEDEQGGKGGPNDGRGEEATSKSPRKEEVSTDPATDPQAATMVLAPYLKLFAQCIRKNRLPNEMEAEVQVLLLDALVHLGALSGFGARKPASADRAAGEEPGGHVKNEPLGEAEAAKSDWSQLPSAGRSGAEEIAPGSSRFVAGISQDEGTEAARVQAVSCSEQESARGEASSPPVGGGGGGAEAGRDDARAGVGGVDKRGAEPTEQERMLKKAREGEASLFCMGLHHPAVTPISMGGASLAGVVVPPREAGRGMPDSDAGSHLSAN
ncbi:AP2 domain transcription factor AP2IX-8 [Besnoitia besnoiti]|uniref:AP2 domain transcription factor AP2IX-8 n=1 Tax=Besnoitia besnoiti TaxID=94643 RepID=A0A2A9MAS8_BESBE|nr:AP2 domain transcription factor AP2IX-8 [Besnoitia besnoiti]PFH32492.1 AP2 domain transcription factor AP2IX-8 [Besnoitia besnoiti]